MADDPIEYTSFLGTGWSFPPAFSAASGTVVMTSDAEDIHASLMILFGTALGERFLNPKYGLDVRDMLFEPMSTTMKTLRGTNRYKDSIQPAFMRRRRSALMTTTAELSDMPAADSQGLIRPKAAAGIATQL